MARRALFALSYDAFLGLLHCLDGKHTLTLTGLPADARIWAANADSFREAIVVKIESDDPSVPEHAEGDTLPFLPVQILETDVATDNAALCMAIHDLRQDSRAYERGLDEGRAKAIQVVRQLIREPVADIPPATGILCPTCHERLGNKQYGMLSKVYGDAYREVVVLLEKPYPPRSFLLPDAMARIIEDLRLAVRRHFVRGEDLQRAIEESHREIARRDDQIIQLRQEVQRLHGEVERLEFAQIKTKLELLQACRPGNRHHPEPTKEAGA